MRSFTRSAETGALREEWYTTPFGWGALLVDGDLPLAHDFPDPERHPGAADSRDPWCALLRAYFSGEPVTFPFDARAFARRIRCSSFESDILTALAHVPYGRVVSYGQLAAAAGHPRAQRAAGGVMARNRLTVILPCHRVIRGDGRLGEWGDDPAWKRRLLELERVTIDVDGRVGTGP